MSRLYRLRNLPDQLSQLSTSQIPTEKQSLSKWLSWPSNCSDVWCLHPLWQMVPLLSFFWLFVLYIFSNMENRIVSNKYKNWRYRSNHNSHIFSIEHLPFRMVHHYSQQPPCTLMNGSFWLTTPNTVIGSSTGIFLIFCEG